MNSSMEKEGRKLKRNLWLSFSIYNHRSDLNMSQIIIMMRPKKTNYLVLRLIFSKTVAMFSFSFYFIKNMKKDAWIFILFLQVAVLIIMQKSNVLKHINSNLSVNVSVKDLLAQIKWNNSNHCCCDHNLNTVSQN